MIFILANAGQFSLFHQPLSLFVVLHSGIFVYMIRQKTFSPKLACSPIASNKRGHAVTANGVNTSTQVE